MSADEVFDQARYEPAQTAVQQATARVIERHKLEVLHRYTHDLVEYAHEALLAGDADEALRRISDGAEIFVKLGGLE